MPHIEANNENLDVSQETVNSLFERQVRLDPSAVAVLSSEGSMSYEELDLSSSRVAQALKEKGVSKGDVIGVSMRRSPEFVSALLGILKSGGAYLPINATWPRKRVESVLKAASACVTVVDDFTNDELSEFSPTLNINDATKARVSIDVGESSKVPILPKDLAYVNFTSGSSGSPKGVMIPHQGVTSLLLDQTYVDLSPKTVTLQHFAPSFDPMTFEIWGPLLHGGTCALFDGTFPTLGRLHSAILEYQVNTMVLTASLFNMVVDEAPEILTLLETLLVGGEALSVHHTQKAKLAAPELSIVNAYGPTEVTFIATYFLVAVLEQDAKTVPLGNPLSHRGVHILNEYLEPTDVGEVGEICVSGPGLALGYIQDDVKTAEAFVTTDSIGGVPLRIYRTGDLGRLSETGYIEFQGRSDTQVQLNGFRIELEEIDRNLVAHPSVNQAATAVRGEGVGLELCAAIVAPDGLPKDLVTHLAKSLPTYMVPQKFEIVEELPLNSHGKIDRERVAGIFLDKNRK